MAKNAEIYQNHVWTTRSLRMDARESETRARSRKSLHASRGSYFARARTVLLMR